MSLVMLAEVAESCQRAPPRLPGKDGERTLSAYARRPSRARRGLRSVKKNIFTAALVDVPVHHYVSDSDDDTQDEDSDNATAVVDLSEAAQQTTTSNKCVKPSVKR